MRIAERFKYRARISTQRHEEAERFFSILKPEYHKSVLMYKCINNSAPDYLCNLFDINTNSNIYSLRSSAKGNLFVPRPNSNNTVSNNKLIFPVALKTIIIKYSKYNFQQYMQIHDEISQSEFNQE
jgi:hypothetical protein